MTTNNLVPTPITDKNGKQTIVYRSPDAPAKDLSSIPAPTRPGWVEQAYIPPTKATGSQPEREDYADRLKRIASENLNDTSPAAIAAKGQLAIKAFENFGNIMIVAGDEQGSSEREDFALRIGELANSQDFASLILIERFAAVHYTIADHAEGTSEWEEPLAINFEGEDTSDWESDYTGTGNYTEIIDLIQTLRENGLMGRNETPEHGEPRFLAHLYMSASKTINYRHDDDETIAYIKFVDEFPERADVIAEGIGAGVHIEGIRAMFEGEVHKGVASGVL